MRSPFKFLDAYTPKDKGIFFGRDKEIEQLQSMVSKTPLVVVYGLSGTGKTSLVQAGLAKHFDGPDWLPFLIRKGENINLSLRETLRDALDNPAPQANLIQLVEDLFSTYFRPVYLMFDQFEELLIMGSEEEQTTFMHDLQEILRSELPCRLMLILREEYIGQLYDFERVIPSLFDHKLRVEPMTNKHVQEVMLGSFEAFNIKLEGDASTLCKQMVDKLSKGKSSISLPYLQVYLDMLYRTDYARDYPNGTDVELPPLTFTKAEIEELGDLEDVMERFLREQLQALQETLSGSHSNVPKDVVRRVLDTFVTDEGTKRPIAYIREKEDKVIQLKESNVRETLSFIPDQVLSECLEGLQRARILRFGNDTIELAHDTLAALIDNERTDEQRALNRIRQEIRNSFAIFQRTGDFLTSGQLELYRPAVPALNLNEEQSQFLRDSQAHRDAEAKAKEEELKRERQLRQTAQKNRRWATALAVIAFGIAVVTVFFFFRAEKAKAEAISANNTAQRRLVKSYEADLARLNTELLVAKDKRTTFNSLGAEEDVLQLTRLIIDSLEQMKNSVEIRLDSTKNQIYTPQ